MTPARTNQNWLPSIFNEFLDNNWLAERRNATAPAVNIIEIGLASPTWEGSALQGTPFFVACLGIIIALLYLKTSTGGQFIRKSAIFGAYATAY